MSRHDRKLLSAEADFAPSQAFGAGVEAWPISRLRRPLFFHDAMPQSPFREKPRFTNAAMAIFAIFSARPIIIYHRHGFHEAFPHFTRIVISLYADDDEAPAFHASFRADH